MGNQVSESVGDDPAKVRVEVWREWYQRFPEFRLMATHIWCIHNQQEKVLSEWLTQWDVPSLTIRSSADLVCLSRFETFATILTPVVIERVAETSSVLCFEGEEVVEMADWKWFVHRLLYAEEISMEMKCSFLQFCNSLRDRRTATPIRELYDSFAPYLYLPEGTITYLHQHYPLTPLTPDGVIPQEPGVVPRWLTCKPVLTKVNSPPEEVKPKQVHYVTLWYLRRYLAQVGYDRTMFTYETNFTFTAEGQLMLEPWMRRRHWPLSMLAELTTNSDDAWVGMDAAVFTPTYTATLPSTLRFASYIWVTLSSYVKWCEGFPDEKHNHPVVAMNFMYVPECHRLGYSSVVMVNIFGQDVVESWGAIATELDFVQIVCNH